MLTLAELRRFLEPWDKFGFEAWHDALIWGSLTETTWRAWLHQVMMPHAPEVLDLFYKENDFLEAFRHPQVWRDLNGFSLFAGCLSLYGPDLPSSPPRVFRAYDVVSSNVGGGEVHHRFDGIIFGCAEHDKAAVWLVESRSGEVVSVDRETRLEMFRWPDFDTFLSSALNELSANWSDEDLKVRHLSFTQRPI